MKRELKSHFYFIPQKPGEFDSRYDIENVKVNETIRNIEKRGHY